MLPLLLALLAAAPAAPVAAGPRQAQLTRGLADQVRVLAEAREHPERHNLRTDKPGVNLLLDAVGTCVTEERVGRRGDGGKWVCNAYRLAAQKPCVVYGFGAGTEVSFEEAMARDYGCEVHLFDPSPHAVKRFAAPATRELGAGSVTFHAWGLGPVSRDPAKAMELVLDGQPCEARTLAAIAKALGHARVDVLKIDIEGGEWAALDEVFRANVLEALQVRQLQLELHVRDGATPEDLFQLVERLAARGFVLFRKELNPWSPGACAEYAFAERGYLLGE